MSLTWSRGSRGSTASDRRPEDTALYSIIDPFNLVEYDYSRRRRLLLGSLAAAALSTMIGLTVVVWSSGVPALERHLQRDVTRAVFNDVEALQVRVVGQSVSVSGTVGGERDRDRVVERVRTRWGIRSVNAEGLTVK